MTHAGWAANRYPISDPAGNGDTVVVDQVTGLAWQTTFSASVTWQQAIDFCRSQKGYAGIDGWRLPDFWEQVSLADIDGTGTLSGFPHTGQQLSFWTASTDLDDPLQAWHVYEMGWYGDRMVKYHPFIGVRCVGSPRGTPVAGRFAGSDPAGSGQKVYSDPATGLVWAGYATTAAWKDALAACEGLSWAGFDDWRLPNALEAVTALDDRSNPSTGLPNPPSYLWTSNPQISGGSSAWAFKVGIVSKTAATLMSSDPVAPSPLPGVRCIRGGNP